MHEPFHKNVLSHCHCCAGYRSCDLKFKADKLTNNRNQRATLNVSVLTYMLNICIVLAYLKKLQTFFFQNSLDSSEPIVYSALIHSSSRTFEVNFKSSSHFMILPWVTLTSLAVISVQIHAPPASEMEFLAGGQWYHVPLCILFALLLVMPFSFQTCAVVIPKHAMNWVKREM